MSETTNVVLLGSTGSIGTQALDVIGSHRDRYRVMGLAAGRNEELLSQQATDFGVPPDRAHLGVDASDALAELAALPEADVVLNAVVGFAGLPATLAALEHGKRLALANKESLIAGGPVVAKVRGAGGGEIVPSTRRCGPAPRTRSAASSSPPAAGRSAASRAPSSSALPSPTRCSIRRGRWAPRSPSTRRR
jgi:1-deoxy-D-xylulose 5-phosphate reductoisomerase